MLAISHKTLCADTPTHPTIAESPITQQLMQRPALHCVILKNICNHLEVFSEITCIYIINLLTYGELKWRKNNMVKLMNIKRR